MTLAKLVQARAEATEPLDWYRAQIALMEYCEQQNLPAEILAEILYPNLDSNQVH